MWRKRKILRLRYTAVTGDLLHYGHINLLRRAKALVEAIRYVDLVIPETGE